MIDSHTHLDQIFKYHPERIAWLISRKCKVISWAFGDNIQTLRDLASYLANQVRIIETLRHTGLPCWFLTGIHPRNIPADLALEAIPELLMPFIEHPQCLGIGEIGLEAGNNREHDILLCQLALHPTVQHLGKRIGIHTPRNEKPQITRMLLDILNRLSIDESIIVIDHTTPQTLPWVLDAGFHAGITVSPHKTSLKELQIMLGNHAEETNRIMINSDSGSEFYEDFVKMYHTPALKKSVREQIGSKTAKTFFTLPGDRR